jgi:hypothetical protein
MQISQENGATAGGANGYYPTDCFGVFMTSAGTFQAGQMAIVTPGGSPNRLRISVATADATVNAGDLFYIMTHIEGLRVADLMFGTAAAKTVTLQFGVKAPAGTYCVIIENSAANHSYVAEYVITAADATTGDVISRDNNLATFRTWLRRITISGLRLTGA